MRLFKLEDWSPLRAAADAANAQRDDTRRAFIEAAQAKVLAEAAYLAAVAAHGAAHAALNAYNAECQWNGSPYARAYGTGVHDGESLLPDPELEDRIRSSGLPPPIVGYLLACMAVRVWIPAVEAIREGPDEVIANLREIFLVAARHAGVSIQELLESIDFQPSNLNQTHLDTVLAILRAVNFLIAEGFSEIRPVKACQGSKTVDLNAARGGRSYGFEVTCFTARSDRPLGTLCGDIVAKYEDKRAQLDSALMSGSAAVGLIFVLNRELAVNLGRRDEYLPILEDAHLDVGNPSDVHFALVTGRSTAVTTPEGGNWEIDDCAFPPWK